MVNLVMVNCTVCGAETTLYVDDQPLRFVGDKQRELLKAHLTCCANLNTNSDLG